VPDQILAQQLPYWQSTIGNQATLRLLGNRGQAIQRESKDQAQDAKQDVVAAPAPAAPPPLPVAPVAQRPKYQLLTKPKKLREEPSTFSTTLDTLQPGRLVRMLEMPQARGVFSRSWAKVSTVVRGKETEGYINTKNEKIDNVQPRLPALPEGVAKHSVVVNDTKINYEERARLPSNIRQFRNLPETVDFYKGPDASGKKLTKLLQGRLVEIGTKQGPDRTWTEISATVNGEKTWGWVRLSKQSLDQSPLVAHGEAGQLMARSGPTVEDIVQNRFGDCYLLAALLSITRKNPSFIQNELFVSDPTRPAARHTLCLYTKGQDQDAGKYKKEWVTVSNTVLQYHKDTVTSNYGTLRAGTNYGAKGAWNWPAIVEKAYTALPNRPQRNDLEGGQAYNALGILTGKPYVQKTANALFGQGKDQIDPKNKKAIIEASKLSTKYMTVETPRDPPNEWKEKNQQEGQGASGERKVGGIGFGHAYELVSANDDEVVLRNPWGRFGRVKGKVMPDAAESVLSWDELRQVADNVTMEQEPAVLRDLKNNRGI
jgi:hypothetical protein